MTQVLIIGYVWPEPKSSAAGSRMMQLINAFLSQAWQITFASPATPSEFRVDLKTLGVAQASIELNNSSFDSFVAELKPDIVLFDRFMMEEQFAWRVEQACPNALRILDTVDLHFLREARRKASKTKRPVALEDLHSDLAKREIAAILRSDMSLLISDFELDFLVNQFKLSAEILFYSPFMLEPMSQLEQDALPRFANRKDFISIGNFLHAPNWDAVLYLKESIWPLIRTGLPNAELHVYGAYPTEKVFALHKPQEGFYVQGRADSALEVMRQAKVLLAPLRFGAGLKGKFIDAMQCGTPSVTTSIGAEGMTLESNWAGFIEDDSEAFANAAIMLHNNEAVWKQSQSNAFKILEARFDTLEHAALLLERIEYVREQLQTHRLNNFYGAMLRHHSMQSTKYLSRWIEAKNKPRY